MVKCIAGSTLTLCSVMLFSAKLIAVGILTLSGEYRQEFVDCYDLDMSIFGFLPEVGCLVMLIFGICLLTQSVNESKVIHMDTELK